MIDTHRKAQLAEFVAYAKTLRGDEKGEAQVFLDRLFRAFSRAGYKEAGATLEERVRNDRGGTGFADLVWKPIVLIEMKKRGEDLSRHLLQAFRYWEELVPGRPRYVVLCNFDEFRVYDFDQDIHQPQDTVRLEELPDRYGPLNFLWPTNERAHFRVDREKVTREAADHLAAVYRALKNRSKVGADLAQRFVLQALVCLFSEDIGLLPKHFFTSLLDECIDPPKAFDLMDGLFRAMNTRDGARGGRFAGVPYFNGGIFSQSAAVDLDPQNEVAILKKAATYNWAEVSPDIFGTIFQHSMDAKERHAMGAHYTSQVDIMRIVGPTIVQPFTTAIQRAGSVKELTTLRDRLTSLRVLDPACGSGNFLYVAYREMRRVEASIILRQSELSKREATGQTAFAGVSPKQFYGMDILPFAVELAKVTLSLAPKLASDELHTGERTLPLDNLDRNIREDDALIQKDGSRTKWPEADVIIGNPPFLGAKRLKPDRGADYVNAVRAAYPEVPGMADYCVYWFRHAHDHLPVATPTDPFRGRAGLVGTQNIRNNQSRVGGLGHIVKSGVIVEGVENQPWSGEANVHVSIADWVKTAPSRQSDEPSVSSRGHGATAKRGQGPPPDPRPGKPEPERVESDSRPIDESSLLIPCPRRLWLKVDPKLALLDPEGPVPHPKIVTTTGKRGRIRQDKSYEMAVRTCAEINSTLSTLTDLSGAKHLACNSNPHLVYQGVTPGHDGFVLSPAERKTILRQDAGSSAVIHGYVTGEDLLLENAALVHRYLIDFEQMDILKAQAYPAAFAHVKTMVLPDVARKARDEEKSESSRKLHMTRWWMLWRSRSEFVTELKTLRGRFIACSRVTKRPVFVFLTTAVRPSDKVQAFLFDDDYSFGVLQSGSHWQWFLEKCSKLKADFSYSTESVFETFPWPQSPNAAQVSAVASAGRRIRTIRDNVLPTITGGLRALYRTLELPGKNLLKDAHADLDAAVLDAYGFSPTKNLLKQLLDLNLAVAKSIEKGAPVTAPGVPRSYGEPTDLITDDCVQP